MLDSVAAPDGSAEAATVTAPVLQAVILPSMDVVSPAMVVKSAFPAVCNALVAAPVGNAEAANVPTLILPSLFTAIVFVFVLSFTFTRTSDNTFRSITLMGLITPPCLVGSMLWFLCSFAFLGLLLYCSLESLKFFRVFLIFFHYQSKLIPELLIIEILFNTIF